MVWFHRTVAALCALVWMFPAWAAGGYVYDAAGDVYALVDKAEQHLKKNDHIASGMVINTGDRSYAVLKFEDGQVVTMQANSTFHIREYHYVTAKPEQGSVIFSMLKGGMRFITGLIAQRNKDAFKLTTPNMTLGIRGTDFMVAMVEKSVYGQVLTGGIDMTNAAGTAEFTAGQAAVVASPTSLPMAIAVAAIPVGTFTQLLAIPTPPAVPAGSAAAGGASTTATAATAGSAAGVSASTIAIGAAVATGVVAIANTSTTTHH